MLEDSSTISELDRVYNDIESAYDSTQFTKFSDYLATGKTGFDHTAHTQSSPFGGVSYTDGLRFIQEIWDSTHGVQDLMLSLYHSGDNTLVTVFNTIREDATENLDDDQTLTDLDHLLGNRADFSDYLSSADPAPTYSAIILSDYFTSETLTDSYINLYITRLEDIIKEGADITETSETLIPDPESLGQ